MALAFAGGILVRERANPSPALAWALLSASALLHPVLRLLGRPRAALAALYLLVAATGWLRLDLAAKRPPDHHLAHFVSDEPRLIKLRGIIATDPTFYTSPPMPLSGESKWLSLPEHKTRFELDVEAVELSGAWRATDGRALVTLRPPRVWLRYGDRVVVTGTARAPSPSTNPGQLDLRRYFRRKGLHLSLTAERADLRIMERGQGNPVLRLASVARNEFRDVLDATLGREHEATRTMLCAAILGDRAELDEDIEQAFQRSGTMHLLAISGLHVCIVAGLVWTLTSLVGLGRRVSGGLVLTVVLLYALMTGFTPAVARAAVMTIAFVGAIVGRRRPDALQATALAALALLAWQPYDLFNAGFQLSFVAVIGICCLYGDFRAWLDRPEKLAVRLLVDERVGHVRRVWRETKRPTINALAISLAAWLAVFPLLAYYFHLFSPVTVLANLPAVPLFGFVVIVGFVYLGIGVLWLTLAALIGLLPYVVVKVLVFVVTEAARWPLAWTYCAAPSLGWLAAYYALGALVLARRRVGLNSRRAAALWLVGVAVYLLATPRPDGLELTVLDVRHGSAAVLRYPDGTTVVADCGSFGRVDVGRHVVAPALWHWGVRRIDLLAVSHADLDHLNGIPSLLERFPIGRVIYSPVLERSPTGRQLLEMLDRRGIPHEPAVAGDRFLVGQGNRLEVLGPADWLLRALPDKQNESALVLRAEHAGRHVLLPADIEDAGATVLLRSCADVRADVLVVPHHGGRLAPVAAFAAAVRPAFVLCSNHIERLSPDALAPYEAAGARSFATCWDGAVTAVVKSDGVRVETYRKRKGMGE